MYHDIHYAKCNKKYMKDYSRNKELSYLKQYWEINDLNRWGMSEELPVNGFKWVEENVSI